LTAALRDSDARRLEACLAGGGVAVFPADTVYGLCCDPEDERAVRRLYALKARPADRPAAVMFFELEPALGMLAELSECERAALAGLFPGPVTVLLENRGRRFPLACASEPSTLGLRVPRLSGSLQALRTVRRALLQSSANISGEAEPRALSEVPAALREGADLVLDGGELPGIHSTVVDIRDYERSREWHVLREGAFSIAALERALAERPC
jgi:L-threonylcarbamoyladenylate synthase